MATRIEAYISNLAGRNESGGAAQSAWWTDAQPEFIGQLVIAPVAEFEERAKDAVAQLVGAAPRSARSGLVVLARAEEGGKVSLAALKLVLSDEQLARFDDETGREDPIVEETISNVLPKPSDVKKGALVPHPEIAADARVIDEQLQDPAGYWLKWMGLTARPKEPALAKLAVATIRSVASTLLKSDELGGQAVAAALSTKAAKSGSVTVKEFSAAVARSAELEPKKMWAEAVAKEPTLDARNLSVSPAALARVELVITLDHGVTVRGAASALAGRYRIRPASAGDGWVTELDSVQRPEVREEAKRGGQRGT